MRPPPDLYADYDPTPLYPATVPSRVSNVVVIPGIEAPGIDCGQGPRVRQVHCSSCGDAVTVGGNTCGDPLCSHCWPTWARRAADRCGSRIEGFARYADRHPPRHIIVSLDEQETFAITMKHERWENVMKAFKRALLAKARDLGLTGGAAVLHPYRAGDEAKSQHGEKVWDWIRAQGSRWHDYVKFSPHMHLIAYGYLPKNKPGEFRYKNLGKLTTRDDIEKVSYYALSHCGIVAGKAQHNVTYWGKCSYNRLKCTWQARVSVPLCCSKCGSPMVEAWGESFFVKQTIGDYGLCDKHHDPDPGLHRDHSCA